MRFLPFLMLLTMLAFHSLSKSHAQTPGDNDTHLTESLVALSRY